MGTASQEKSIGPMLITKGFLPEKPQFGKPTAVDLDAINRHALEALSEDDVFVVTMHLANDQIDRSHERFSLPYLERFAETAPGKPVMVGHDKTKEPVGKFFAADVVRQLDGSQHLVTRAYLMASDALVPKVKAGIVRDVSIGASVDKRICDLCEKDYDSDCDHIAGRDYGGKRATLTWTGNPARVEMREGSFVYLGCQYGAQTVTATAPLGTVVKEYVPGGATIVDYGARDVPAPEGEETMELQEALDKIAALEAEKAELTAQKPLIEDGKAYRAYLCAEIARKMKSVGDEEGATVLLKTLENAETATLKQWDAMAQKRFDEKFPPPATGRAGIDPHDKQAPARRFDPLGASPFRRSA